MTKTQPRGSPPPPSTSGMPRWPIIRDIVLFCGGLAGVAYETLFSQTDRPTLLVLFAAMMGLPAFLRADESKKDRDK